MTLSVVSDALANAPQRLAKSEISAETLTRDALSAVDTLNPALNAFVDVRPEHALDMARQSDQRRSDGTAGALEGLPVAVKDSFCVVGASATAASRILEGFHPPYEAGVTARLWDAGAVFLGKTNCDEFSMGSSTEHSIYGATTNPWRRDDAPDVRLTAGGSSGGSAAAVAAGLAWAAVGGDTGGSIRQPASLCGVVGVKPTYGLCSRFGLMAFASSLDQAGAFAARVEDAARLLDVMIGHDPRDATSRQRPEPPGAYLAAARNPQVDDLRIGVARGLLADANPEVAEAVESAARAFKEMGCAVVDIEAPEPRLSLAAYYVIASAEASSNLARYDGLRYGRRADGEDWEQAYARARGEGFGAEVKRRVLVGAHVLSSGYYDAYYRRAQQARTLIADAWSRAFQRCDVALAPTTPSAAFALGEVSDPIAMYQSDAYTVSASLAGAPALSTPWRLDSHGLPMGVQLIAAPFGDVLALRAGAALEMVCPPEARAASARQ